MNQTELQTTPSINIHLQKHKIKSSAKEPRPVHNPDDMYLDGALELVSKMLTMTYYDYVKSLEEVKKYQSKKSLTMTERRMFLQALRTKDECETFYRSKRFQIFTLGQGMKGDEVIETIQKRTGFIE